MNKEEFFVELVRRKKSLLIDCFATMLLTVAIMLLLYKIGQYAPFGNNSLACMDANIQYIDFFAFFKDVLQGKNNIDYTFSKTLGGSAIAVYSYYLSSPFSFLVVLFDKTQLQTFFDLVVMLKLALAGITMSYYLHARFQKSGSLVMILSLAYVFSQYNIAQASNIMWLDGVYMLPVILLGVYRVVHQDCLWKLSVPVALTILFNWYSGAINCLFSAFWFILEYALSVVQEENAGLKWKSVIHSGLRYALGMLLGVLSSCILFLPSIGALQNSSKGGFSLAMLTDLSFIGEIPNVIQNYTYGAHSSYGSVALYCGAFPLIGTLGILFDRMSAKKGCRTILRTSFLLMILLFYWAPFYRLFSLLRDVGSYWYRYSYVGIFGIVFLAAFFYLEEDREYGLLLRDSIIYALVLVFLNYIKPTGNSHVYRTAFVIIIVALLTSLTLKLKKGNRKIIYRCVSVLLVLITSIDVGYNSSLVAKGISDVADYESYVAEETEQVSKLLQYDSGIFRINQTSTRDTYDYQGNLRANYNEALASNYMGISGYTSSPDGSQNEFLDRLGYRMNDVTMCIVNSSIIGADSLLGVKYVLSETPVNGMIELSDLGEYNGRKTYLNPYALPMVFTYRSVTEENAETNNPFEYQNQLYRTLYGESVSVYDPVEYEIVQTGDGNANFSVTYSLKIPDGDVALYGNLPWDSELNATITVNGEFLTAYSRWLSPSVFYISSDAEDETVSVTIEAETGFDTSSIQFYAIDLEKFQSITDKIASGAVDSYEIENGYVKVATHTEESENLYLAIAYDDGWEVTVNGEVVEPELFGDCFYSVALEPGDNVVEMHYHMQYFGAGAVATGLGVLLIIGFTIIEKKRKLKAR
jgi:uncharacterized membrane protein YfhO